MYSLFLILTANGYIETMDKRNIYIALLRGINVGGHNRIKMADLRTLLQSMGFANIQTHLASGNVIFETHKNSEKKLAMEISAEIETHHGFKTDILILSLEEIQLAVLANPFPQATNQPKSLHFNFLSSKPKSPDLQKLDMLKKDSEQYKLINKVFYLHAPEGIGRSKLAAGCEKAIGVPMTGRNWRTVQNILELAENAIKNQP